MVPLLHAGNADCEAFMRFKEGMCDILCTAVLCCTVGVGHQGAFFWQSSDKNRPRVTAKSIQSKHVAYIVTQIPSREGIRHFHSVSTVIPVSQTQHQFRARF